MSDDEGPEDYGDYEEASEIGGDESEVGPEETEPEETEPEEADDFCVEDAAGSDEEDESEAGEAGEGGEDEPFEQAGAASKAAPQRARVDPILRASNKPRIVRCVPPEERMTSHVLQKSEAAYIIATRAEQISKHPTAFVDIRGLHDPVAIAYKELFERRCPLVLRRPVGTGPAGEHLVEEWNPREMALPPLTPPVPLGGSASGSALGRP